MKFKQMRFPPLTWSLLFASLYTAQLITSGYKDLRIPTGRELRRASAASGITDKTKVVLVNLLPLVFLGRDSSQTRVGGSSVPGAPKQRVHTYTHFA